MSNTTGLSPDIYTTVELRKILQLATIYMSITTIHLSFSSSIKDLELVLL